MPVFRVEKVVANLPSTLQADTVYAVRAGAGFDLYITDATGSVAHQPNSSSGLAKTTVSISPVKYGQAGVTVALAGVTPSNFFQCQLVPNADFDADDLEGFKVAAEAGTNEVVFTIYTAGPIVGQFDISYTKG
jgi:hypothetical protein